MLCRGPVENHHSHSESSSPLEPTHTLSSAVGPVAFCEPAHPLRGGRKLTPERWAREAPLSAMSPRCSRAHKFLCAEQGQIEPSSLVSKAMNDGYFETICHSRGASRKSRVRGARWTPIIFFEAVCRRDAYTGEHTRAVARLCELVGHEMELPAHKRRMLLVGALLHDVGKLFVPDAILKKPGPLTPKERAIIERHPITGSRILEQSKVPSEVALMARHHHERYDGSGYPHGLSGAEIPLSARIVQVADAFDAMIRNRSYRRGIPWAEALGEIERNTGSQFDPGVVRRFLKPYFLRHALPLYCRSDRRPDLGRQLN